MMRLVIATLLSLVGLSLFAIEPGEETLLPAGRKWIADTTASWKKEASDSVKVWPGVRADKKARRVEIAATGAGTEAAGLLEFLLVSDNGKAYESVAVTSARKRPVAVARNGTPQASTAAIAAVSINTMRVWPVSTVSRIRPKRRTRSNTFITSPSRHVCGPRSNKSAPPVALPNLPSPSWAFDSIFETAPLRSAEV